MATTYLTGIESRDAGHQQRRHRRRESTGSHRRRRSHGRRRNARHEKHYGEKDRKCKKQEYTQDKKS